MKSVLTEARLAAVYDCLREFPPFSRMKLPCAAKVQFIVCKSRENMGFYSRYSHTDHHVIEISENTVGHFDTLARVMAHEMVHMAQDIHRTATPNAEHNAEFKRISKRVCRLMGWDSKAF